MGKMQRNKGASFERKVVAMAVKARLPAVRVAPLQAGHGDRFADAQVDLWLVECKHHRKVRVASFDGYVDKGPRRVLVYQHNGKRPKVVMDLAEWLILVARDRERRIEILRRWDAPQTIPGS